MLREGLIVAVAVLAWTQGPMGCIREEEVRYFESGAPRTKRVAFDKLLNPPVRDELAKAVRILNAQNHAIPAGKINEVILVAPNQLDDEVIKRESGRTQVLAVAT